MPSRPPRRSSRATVSSSAPVARSASRPSATRSASNAASRASDALDDPHLVLEVGERHASPRARSTTKRSARRVALGERVDAVGYIGETERAPDPGRDLGCRAGRLGDADDVVARRARASTCDRARAAAASLRDVARSISASLAPDSSRNARRSSAIDPNRRTRPPAGPPAVARTAASTCRSDARVLVGTLTRPMTAADRSPATGGTPPSAATDDCRSIAAAPSSSSCSSSASRNASRTGVASCPACTVGSLDASGQRELTAYASIRSSRSELETEPLRGIASRHELARRPGGRAPARRRARDAAHARAKRVAAATRSIRCSAPCCAGSDPTTSSPSSPSTRRRRHGRRPVERAGRSRRPRGQPPRSPAPTSSRSRRRAASGIDRDEARAEIVAELRDGESRDRAPRLRPDRGPHDHGPGRARGEPSPSDPRPRRAGHRRAGTRSTSRRRRSRRR